MVDKGQAKKKLMKERNKETKKERKKERKTYQRSSFFAPCAALLRLALDLLGLVLGGHLPDAPKPFPTTPPRPKFLTDHSSSEHCAPSLSLRIHPQP